MRSSRSILASSAVLAFASCVRADTINVPGDQPTIQAGIDAAVDGDEVVVADGTYTGPGNVNLDFGGRAITVRSASGDPEQCVIDCQSTPGTRGFIFQIGETPEAVVNGLTVTHGNMVSDHGGAILLVDTSPTIKNCRFIDNSAFGAGGAIAVFGGGPMSGPMITDCDFFGNSSIDENGGAISLSYATDVRITGCVFLSNAATLVGGRGGGLFSIGSIGTVFVADCWFLANSAFSGGGIAGGRFTVIDCQFNLNTALALGGGMFIDYEAGSVVTNCTLTGNASGLDGGGIRINAGITTVTNCIVWDNTPTQIYPVFTSTDIVTFCDVQGGYPGIGNIDADPRIPGVGMQRLSPVSPCIDAGSNQVVPADVTTDMDGNPPVHRGPGDARHGPRRVRNGRHGRVRVPGGPGRLLPLGPRRR